jgi:hypothetical protein
MRLKLIGAGVMTLGLMIGTATAAGATTNLNGALSITGGAVRTSVHTAFQTDNYAGTTVTDVNRAQAVSVNCAPGCKTVAIAVQVDLAAGPILGLHAGNAAIAQTYNAVGADTCASAYQFVIAPNTQVVFSAAGKAGIAAVEAGVAAEARSGDSCDVITANTDAAMGTLAGVLTDPASYTAGNPPAGGILPHVNFNRSHQSA